MGNNALTNVQVADGHCDVEKNVYNIRIHVQFY